MPLFQRRVISYHSFIFLSSSFFWTFSFRREELVCQVLTAKVILTESFSLVKNFFYFFFAAFLYFSSEWYVITSFPICQQLFSIFLELFRCVPTAKYILPSVPTSVNTYFGSFRSTLYSAFQANFSFYLLGKNSSYFLLFLWKILIFSKNRWQILPIGVWWTRIE